MFLVWIISGLVSGLLANQLFSNQNLDWLSQLFLGIVGSLVGAFLFNNVVKPDLIGSYLISVIISVLGSIAWLIAYHAVVTGDKNTDKV
jgi:uncharacterized membrane protein YeaQ/YmgE (transglycosylase-associated protein family)